MTARAELVEFHPLRVIAAVLHGGVVALTAFRACHGDNNAVSLFLCHGCLVVRERFSPVRCFLLDDAGDHAGANGSAALTDGEPQSLFHRDRSDQLDAHLHVIPGHHHFRALRKVRGACDVRGADVELRLIPIEERGVTPALISRQNIHLR